MLDDPAVRRHRVVVRRGEGVLGRQPVVDRQDPDAAALGQEPAGRVVAVEVAVHPAAAVEVHQQRAAGRRTSRHEEPAAQPAHRQVADGADRLVAAGHHGLEQDRAASGRHGQGGDLRLAGELLQPEHQLGVRGEGLAVDRDQRAGQRALDALRQSERGPEGERLGADLGGGEEGGGGGHGAQPSHSGPESRTD